MRIQVLGMGCPKCRKTAANAEKAVKRSGIDAEIEKVETIDRIAEFGVLMTPALAIDGEVKCSGRIPRVEEVLEWIGERGDPRIEMGCP
jgi:small redox-active disulfide protein 2